MRLLLALLLLASCSSKAPVAETPREPAQASIDVVSNGQEISDAVANYLRDPAAHQLALETMIRSAVQLASNAQQLSASFDVRLDEYLKNPGAAPYSVQTNLDCQLWDAYQITENSEHQLLEIQRLLLDSKNQHAYNWFIGLLFANRGDTDVGMLTKAQLTRTLAYQHTETCGSLVSGKCLAFPKVTDPKKRPFDAFSDKEMLAFKDAKMKRIAIYAGIDFSSNGRGACYSDEDREPQADTPAPGVFDWTKRATMGYVLQPGTYAITYDDGPHKLFTPQLEKMWSESGLVKPSFFWLAGNVKPNLPLAQMVRDHGYLIGSHSYIHADLGSFAKTTQASLMSRVNRTNPMMPKHNPAAVGAEWEKFKDDFLTHEIITSTDTVYSLLDLEKKNADGTMAYGQPANGERLFRLPYGSGVKNPLVGQYFQKANIRHYFWTIDSLDWQDKNPLSVKQRVEKQMQATKRGIILFHDIHPQSVEASRLLLADIKNKKTPVPVTLVPLPTTW